MGRAKTRGTTQIQNGNPFCTLLHFWREYKNTLLISIQTFARDSRAEIHTLFRRRCFQPNDSHSLLRMLQSTTYTRSLPYNFYSTLP